METIKTSSAIEQIIEIANGSDEKQKYRMLGRFQQDCLYYLGFGYGDKERLWAKDPKEHISCMKILWDSFDEEQKPQWITMEEIEAFDKAMNLVELHSVK